MMHPSDTASSRSWWITHAAFLLALAVVIARASTVDALREPWDATPGSGSTTHGPGPAGALVFDLLITLPAVLVLIRRAIDAEFRLRFRWSHLPLILLAVWTVLSTAWSADKFAAAVTSAHFLSSACLLWAMSQLVRSWVRLRLVAAVSFGLLLLLGAQSLIYKYVDAPADLSYFNDKKAEILEQHGWAPDSFGARQFEHKVASGETAGFFNSPNTLAALGVLLFSACLGIGIQKLIDGDDPQWLAMPIVASLALIFILWQAASKTAAATPFVGCATIALFTLCRDQLRRRSTAAYAAGVLLVTTGLAAVVGFARRRHGLFAGHFSNSLDFRWKYWVASAGVFSDHPLLGVGWNNFGLHYLSHRLPEASEEIKDPHNFLVRVFVELGMVGGLLLTVWLLQLAWEITRPDRPSTRDDQLTQDDNVMTIKSPVIVVAVGMLFSTLASIDFTQPLLDLLALMLRPVLLLLALLLGTMSASMLAPHTWHLDTRRAPWIFYCLVVGLGLFLLHNLIDFSWFEPGPMALFMMLIGSALGMAPASQSRPARRILGVVAAVTTTAVWIAATLFFVCPIIVAEEASAAADDSITTAKPDRSPVSIAHFSHAADLLATATSLVPYNAEFPLRQAKALLNLGDLARAQPLIQLAIQLNPRYIDAYLLDANVKLAARTAPEIEGIKSDFDTILQLNPNDVSLHVQYAEALDRFGMRSAAVGQYDSAIRDNAALPEGEPKRLSSDQLTDLRERLRRDRMSMD